MRGRFGLVMGAAALLVGALAAPAVAAGGNADAAHSCAQSGYTALKGTDGTLFKNVGDCVAFVAKGGTITGVATTCTYTTGVTGCMDLDAVVVPALGGGSSTTVSGMFSFPATDWAAWVGGNAEGIAGSGTWTTSAGTSGTWTATHTSSIYPGQFYIYDSASGTGKVALCGTGNTRYVGVHFDMFQGSTLVGAVEVQVRNATYGTNYLFYQGFTSGPSGEPWGSHNTTDVTGLTFRC